MHLNRLLIPKNILFYLLFLGIALMYIIAVLWGYYHLAEIEKYFDGTSLPFLDLHQSGNVLDWFYSLLWIYIAILSIIILGSSLEHKDKFLQVLFWINVPLVALILSADTICSFSTFILQIIELGQKNSASQTASLYVLRLIFFLFILSEFLLLFNYIRTMSNSRLILTGSVMICFFTLVFVLLFGSAVPREALIRRNNEPVLQKFLASEKSSSDYKELDSENPPAQKTEKPESSGKTDNMDNSGVPEDSPYDSDSEEKTPPSDEEKSDEDSIFRNAADENEGGEGESSGPEEEKSDSAAGKESPEKADPHVYKWEDIFGWEKSFEDNWKAKGTLEEFFNMSGSIESHLWGNKTPDIPRIRESIHYGGTGIFLLLLSLTIQLIARAGRVAVEKKLLRQLGDFAAVCELARKS
ncbi:MAG: hypothetical protein Q4G69_08625 [Planctomycetia bacterium]|nr:hypothetical protein [Planctomycetia bacterium]